MKHPAKLHFQFMSTDNKKFASKFTMRAPAGKRFDAANVDETVNAIIAKLDAKNPAHKYRLVRLPGHVYRFVWGDQAAA